MPENYLQKMLKTSHVSGGSSGYVDQLYESYLRDPNSVPEQWHNYFSALPEVSGQKADISHVEIRDYFLKRAREHRPAVSADSQQFRKQAHVLQLINAFRSHGHHQANLDPLGLTERKHIPDLQLVHHQLSEADFSTVFSSESPLTKNGATLKEIYQGLKRTYCDTLGIEYTHITDEEQTRWLQERIESVYSHPTYDAQKKKHILAKLTAAEGLERYLHTKYVGQKRFSLEGGDSLIPLLDELIYRSGAQGCKELVIGMAHRGRLNVLVNMFGKSPDSLFQEFEGGYQQDVRTGDVKYHMGFSSDVMTEGGVLHISLSFNPSHLEIIAPVVQGAIRARQYRRHDLVAKQEVLPIIIHGDAAFAAQGVVMETFNFSQARGYATGGTVHVVINNQVGFTTSNPLDSRSTLYCTDVAKMVQAPILHVNGDDPEMVIFASQVALDFRHKFKRDVVIDLVCYRRHGHNEADEPSMTQPVMYSAIAKLPTPRQLYADRLVSEGVISESDAIAMINAYRDALDKGESLVKTIAGGLREEYVANWHVFLNRNWDEPVDTRVPIETLKKLAKQLEIVPEDFSLNKVVARVMQGRNRMTAGELPVDWGYAENLAYATLLADGYPLRLSGQDSGRGTFAHRHAVLHDAKTADTYVPLQYINGNPEDVIIIDSVLSEEAVLGFEYGYASSEPSVLTIWEAQFGDFANGAQVVIDQFISSAEQKWGRLCGLVMLLPHGYEGQGPEHSSARLERYLQLCAQHNMQVCVPSTPAQMYHMLRRQMVRPFRKPLIVMTPKSLLRHKLCVSSLEDLASGKFEVIIPEIDELNAKKVRRVVLCSGKVYYDLLAARREKTIDDIAIVRIEQLYPFPEAAFKEVMQAYNHVKDIVWCQEEPKNQGAWFSSQHHIIDGLSEVQSLSYAGRDFFASPAVGFASLHLQQQKALVEEALK